MSTEITDDGRENLREYITGPDGWRYLAVLDETGSIAGTYDLVSRSAWGPPADNPITAAVKVSGTDGEIDAPVEVSGSALLVDEDDDLADAMHEDGHGATNLIVDGEGAVVLQHTVEVPQR